PIATATRHRCALKLPTSRQPVLSHHTRRIIRSKIPMKNLKIAIISFEHMHANSYAASFDRVTGAELVGIADSDPDRLALVKDRYPNTPPFHSDYKPLLDETKAEAVIICSSNVDHLPIAREAAARGLHILCEKPLGPTVEESQEIIDLAKKAG